MIADFADGDLIEFTDSHGVGAYGDLKLQAEPGGTLLEFDGFGGSIFLEDVVHTELDASDFLF